MKTTIKKTNIIVLLVLLLGLGACTKSRDNEIADEDLAGELIPISELQADGYEVSLSSTGVLAAGGIQKFQVASQKVPAKLAGILSTQSIQGKPGAVVPVKFQVEPSTLFVERVITGTEQLTAIEKDLVRVVNGKKVLPLFSIRIKAVGVLVPIKNDLGERTHKFRLLDTEVEDATHVRIDLKAENITQIELPKTNPNLIREVLDANALRDKVHSRESLTALLPANLSLSANGGPYATKLTQDEEISGTQVKLMIYTIQKKSEITDKRLLALLDSNVERVDIQSCGSAIAAQTQPSIAIEDCVLVLDRSLAAFQVKAELATDSQGRITDNVQIKPETQQNQGNLIQVGIGSVVRIENAEDKLTLGDESMVALNLLRGKEFLFRRTFENASATLTGFGPGASGNMDIVKFEFERDRMTVKRLTPINGANQTTEIDKEELMSIPAKYFQTRTAQGAAIIPARETTPDKADAISLDWLKNTIPVSNSPLAYFAQGTCFMSTGHQAVANLDQRLNQGSLNFSIQGSYTFVPECISVFGLNDYWYANNLQATYVLSERVSFMVHDPKNDNVKTLDLPFRAQYMLNFGAFTMGQKEQDSYGNSGRLTDEKARPVIQNFLNGRKVTYVLGGVADPTDTNKWVIEGTKTVIADWNKTLQIAFKGTSLERSGDYIDLQIEDGSVPADKRGHLGDLDKNYIWNFSNNMDSGLLGMSQSAPNPRTGYVESGNVLMYGGNLLAYLGYNKEVDKIQAEYEALKQQVLNDAKASAAAAPAAGGGGGDVLGLSQRSGTTGRAGSANERFTPVMGHEAAAFLKTGKLTTANAAVLVQNHSKMVQASQIDTTGLKNQAMEQMSSGRDYVHRIVRKAIAMGEMQNSEFMEALTAAEILKSYGSEITPEEKRLLALESQRLALKAEFTKNFRQGPNCFLNAPTFYSLKKDNSKKSMEQIFIDAFADTLSHELGHNLGMTHNFKGTFDGANFEFEGEKVGREYSSVMDYKPEGYTTYHGPGPYDVHAIRAMYTGLIEVGQAVKNAAKDENGQKVVNVVNAENQPVKVVLPAGKFVFLEDLKNVLVPNRTTNDGKIVKSFWDLNTQMLARFPVKAHGFCTDIDVGGDPTCARWDMGKTPEEVAQFHIDEYNDMYPILNARNARVRGVGIGGYVGRVMNKQYQMRSFLDETLYLLILGYPQQVWVPYAQAAWKGMNQLIETISTPSDSLHVMDPARFSVTQVEVRSEDPKAPAQKLDVLIETKALSDMYVPGVEDSVETRGIELDKLLATQFLTLQSLGNPRYTRYSMQFSYADFERLLLGKSDLESLTISTLEGVLRGQISGLKFINGSPLELDPTLTARVTDSMRYYGVLGATIYLDNNSTRDNANPSSLFQVGSTLRDIPADRLVVSRVGSSLVSPTSLKLFALDPANSSARLVARAAKDRIVIDRLDPLSVQFLAFAAEKDALVKATTRDNFIKVLAAANVNNVLLTPEEIEAGATFELYVDYMEEFFKARIDLIARVEEIVKGGVPIQDVASDLGKIRVADEVRTRNTPFLAIAQKAIETSLTTESQKQIAGMILNAEVLDLEHSYILSSLEQMNRILAIVNPQYNK